MARHRTSRSPSPAGSQHSSRRNTKDEERRDRGAARDKPRDRPRRSRSPADRRQRERDRDRDRDAGTYRRRDRSRDRSLDRRDGYYRDRGGRRDDYSHRDRRRSRDRRERDHSPPRQRPRSRDGDRDNRSRQNHSRDRAGGRRDGNNSPRARGDDRSRASVVDSEEAGKSKDTTPAKSMPAPAQTEAEKKAERLAKLEAWKKKKMETEQQQRKESAASAGGTRQLLAQMDVKAAGTPPATASPGGTSPAATQAAGDASPIVPYGGKFDPKAIAKKASARHQSPTVLGGLQGRATEKNAASLAAPSNGSAASSLPQGKPISGFGFGKSSNDDKAPTKRKLNLDDEETSKRKLAKLPDLSLETTDDAPYVNQDDDDEDSDGDNFAGTEEEAAAAARAAHERREERILQQSMAIETDEAVAVTNGDSNGSEPPAASADNAPEETQAKPEADTMDVDTKEDEEYVDPLDAFMADLTEPTFGATSKPSRTQNNAKALPTPEAYYSDDEEFGATAKEGGVDAKAIMAMAAKRKKKEIPMIDYNKLDIVPVRKNFWVEPSELGEMTEAEVAELRLELDGIKVSGKEVPKPVQKWSHCGLTRPILDVVAKLGYEKPTSIQMQALPVLMSGRDVVGVAKTGSGKTMAFLLPMFRHIKDQEPVKDNEGPVGLILTPTRELAVQIFRDCKPFLKSLGLRAVCAYGGPPIKDQIADLKRGAEIVVATTGRMIDLLAANQGRVVSLRRTTYVVLDEADRMFDMGFEPQVMKIFANLRPDRQIVLFSATMPKIMDALVKKVLTQPVEIEVGGKSVVASEITQIVEVRDEKSKFNRLLELLGELYKDDEDVRSLIFVERQEKADELLRELLRKGYGCMSLHGGKDQVDRDSTISDFKSGVCPVLIATSVAARGLDVKQLKLVVNYDAPNHLEDYVHRAGRTGRAGNTGTAVTFITEEQENCAIGIAKALEQSGQPVPEKLAEMRKAFREKVKAGKAKDQSGFGGKGLERLDKEREAARNRERKTHKAEGEEEDGEDDKKTAKNDQKTEKAATAVIGAASAIVSRDAAKAEAEAKAADGASAAASAAVSVGAGKGGALDKAASAINEINARLARAGQLRPGQPIDNKGPDAGAFHATLEINDFPQKARWAVTNRTNVAKILEATGTSITTKGNFYPPGKDPPAGSDPKLYILIEGDTELVVGNALSELTRLLKEGTMAAADAESRAPASGRYTIT